MDHRIQLHLCLAHHQCPLRHHQVQKTQEANIKKQLGQMKNLALPFPQNPTHEAVFSEVQDHGITYDQGNDRRSPNRVHLDSLKVHPQKDLVLI